MIHPPMNGAELDGLEVAQAPHRQAQSAGLNQHQPGILRRVPAALRAEMGRSTLTAKLGGAQGAGSSCGPLSDPEPIGVRALWPRHRQEGLSFQYSPVLSVWPTWRGAWSDRCRNKRCSGAIVRRSLKLA